MDKPVISPKFDLNDIRKIRDYHDYLFETSPEEYWEEIRAGAEEGHQIIAAFREKKAKEADRAL